MKSVQQDLYDLLSNSPQLAGITVSYGESYLEDSSHELVSFIVSGCNLNTGHNIHPKTDKFIDLVGEYTIIIYMVADNYMRATVLLNKVGDALIQETSQHRFFFENYDVDADSLDNQVRIELSLTVPTLNEPRGN